MIMEFCSKCGSYLKKTENGFLCPRCGNKIRSHVRTPPVQAAETSHPSPIYVVDSSRVDFEKVSQTCQQCGNTDAFRWLAGVSGEHAGVRSERTIEHFRCTKCGHSWAKSS